MSRVLVAALVLVAAVVLATPASAGSCSARVVHGFDTIEAKQQPCTFAVPAGKTAVNLQCQRADPASSWSSNAACSVYSIDEKREMVDGQGKPLDALPAGNYRFNVGGRPGAHGTFSFKLQ